MTVSSTDSNTQSVDAVYDWATESGEGDYFPQSTLTHQEKTVVSRQTPLTRP